MTRKLLMTAAVAAIALTTPIGIGTAEAHGGGFAGGGFHGGGFHGGGFHGRGFFDGYGGFAPYYYGYGGYGGFAPDYYGYGSCYLTVYGTTYCY